MNTPTKLQNILREMRSNEFDDPHLDADGIIGARLLARDWADRIEDALKNDARSVDRILADFHNEHYSVFPRGELTERLCHAFYDQFIGPPESPCKEVEDWT